MKICVLIKQVASEDSPISISDDKKSINRASLNLVTNEPDSYALEEALLIKEKGAISVVEGLLPLCAGGSALSENNPNIRLPGSNGALI